MFRYQASNEIVRNGSFLLPVRFFGVIVGVLVLAICCLDSSKNLKKSYKYQRVVILSEKQRKKTIIRA